MTTVSDIQETEGEPVANFPVPGDQDAFQIRIRHAMRAVGTIDDVALKSGIPKSTINNLLRGSGVRWAAVFAIAQACGVSLDWLATGAAPESPTRSQASPALSFARGRMQLPDEDDDADDSGQDHKDGISVARRNRDSSSVAVASTSNNTVQDSSGEIVRNGGSPTELPGPIIKDILVQAIGMIKALNVVNGLNADPEELAERITIAYGYLIGKKP